ncbi:MAG: AraC family transcriptional regulator, partial [Gammaproteobacteria bacterium]
SREHPIIGVAILAGVLKEIDVDPEPLLTGAGIEPARIHDPGAQVTATQELAFIRHAIAATNVPDLGLRAGRRHHFSLFGMWGFAMASSPTLNEAVRLGLRYIDLTHTFLRWSYVAERNNPRLELVEAYRLGTARRFVIERDMSACITLVQDMTGNRQALRQARFPYPTPEVCDSYEAIFGTNIDFDAARATLLIDPVQLSVPLPQANAMAASLAEEQCRRQLEGNEGGRGIAGRLRRLLLSETGRLPSLPDAANSFGMSVRTLRRRLATEDTSYRSVLDQVRHDLAVQYLENTSLGVDDIADRLGYGDAAGFCHAFRRWKNDSPGRWRRNSRRA